MLTIRVAGVCRGDWSHRESAAVHGSAAPFACDDLPEPSFLGLHGMDLEGQLRSQCRVISAIADHDLTA
jgi:hypothetical protein